MARSYKVGTRTSPLALKQVEEIATTLKRFYPDIRLEVVGIQTYGDKDKHTPISQIEGSDFFTRELDEALIKGEIDFAVHSAKDLPRRLRKGLTVAAITASVDPDDVLVSPSGLKLEELPSRAKIGTSSRRRKTGLKRFRPDLQIVDIRGNIEERLRLLNHHSPFTIHHSPFTNDERRKIDAIVIAAAGLIRLGLKQRITQRIPREIVQPHPLQGALAAVARESDEQLLNLLTVLQGQKTILGCAGKSI